MKSLLLLSILIAVCTAKNYVRAPVPPNKPTIAAIQFGVDAVLSASPVVFGTENFPALVAITPSQIAALQAAAEAWFATRFGIFFPAGPAPKINTTSGFTLVGISVGEPYSVYSIRDATRTFDQIRDDENPIAVRLIEFVASPPTIIQPGFREYGGTYAAQTIPGTNATQVRPGDNIAYGFYNFTQSGSSRPSSSGNTHGGHSNGGHSDSVSYSYASSSSSSSGDSNRHLTLKGGSGCKPCQKNATTLVYFRAFVPTRSSVLLPDISDSVEQFQLYSPLWGPGNGVLQVLFPIVPPPTQYWFFNNMHFPAPTGFAALPPWIPTAGSLAILG